MSAGAFNVGTDINFTGYSSTATQWIPLSVTAPPPATPTGLSATPQACSSGQINLSWNSVSGATNYTLRDGATVIYSGGGTSFSHTGLSANSSHSYTVRAENSSGNSAYSGAVNATAPNTCPPATYTLSVSKNGTGAGTVTSNPAGVSCGADCSQSYTSGTGVTLSASPAVGSVFAGWSGDADCSNGSVTMSANRSCTATFNNAPPTVDSVTISSPTVSADNATQYTITVSGSDASGAGNVIAELILINYQGGNAGAYRGYVTWDNGNYYPTIKNYRACTGGGYAGVQPGYGDTYVNLDSCTTSVSGNTRTTSFVVRFDPSFTTPLTGNDISGLVYDNLWQYQNGSWTNFDTNFSLLYNNASCGAVTLPKTTFAPGEAFTATIAVNNTGTKAWTTDATPHRLGNSGTWGAGGRVELPSSPVNPGAGTTFTVNATAPATPGTYDFSWQMVEELVEWFGSVCSAPSQVTVTEPAPVVTLTPKTTLGGSTGSAFHGEYNGAWGGVVTNVSWSGTNSPTSCVVYRDGIAVSGALAYPGTAQYNIPAGEAITATTTYRVDCTNSGGTGQSNTVTFTVPPPLTNPTYTCGPAGTTVDLGWTPPGGSTGNFIRGHQNPPAWTGTCTGGELCVTDGANPYSWSITPGTTYSWWAHNRVADGNWSNGMWGANFSCTPVTYALNVAKDGAGSGTVGTGDGRIDCGSTCSYSYTYGTVVQLFANPSSGYSFSSWGGACSGSGACVVTMTEAKNVTATFTQSSYTLTVDFGTGAGSGTVTASGISCPGDCSESYSSGVNVAPNAVASVGSVFAGWSGDADCSDGSVTMSGDRSCTATFETTTDGGAQATRLLCQGTNDVALTTGPCTGSTYNTTATTSWEIHGTTNPAQCTIFGDPPPAGGVVDSWTGNEAPPKITSPLLGNTTYVLSCYGQLIDSIDFEVDTNPELWIDVSGERKNSVIISQGDSITLYWDTKGQTCTGSWDDVSRNSSGSVAIPIGAQTEYELYNCDSGASDSVQVEIIPELRES